jgi:serine/threonine protein kinase
VTNGQDTNVLQYVHFHCRLYCAKIGSPADLVHEYQVSAQVHLTQQCPTVMEIVDRLDLPHDRLALICPYYPATVAILPPRECSLAMLLNVALCTIASIAGFRHVGLSHNDIKPSNLMLTTSSQMVVLIDFGSTVPIDSGDASRGTSQLWGRECPAGSREYDMACMASVLNHLAYGGDDYDDRLSLQQLAENIQRSSELTVIDEMILDCINRASEDARNIFSDWVEKVERVRGQLQVDTLVDFGNIWPTQK